MEQFASNTLVIALIAGMLAGFALAYFWLHRRLSGLARRVQALNAQQQTDQQRLTTQGQTIRGQVTELKAALQERERLLAAVSHEFRTPLTLILGYARRLRTEPDADSTVLANGIGQHAQHLKQLVDGMLSMAEPADSADHAVPLSQRTEGLVASLDPLARAAEHDMEVQVAGKLSALVRPEHFDQIVTNLVSNAVKYTPSGGRIKVSLTQVGDQVQFAVSDNGVGIAEGEIEQIFEPFVRGSNANTEVQGSGLGLALVAELVERAGGTISVESKLDRGSTFTVSLNSGRAATIADQTDALPAENNAIERWGNDTAGAARERSTAHPNAPAVTIVEDHSALRDYLVELLSPHYQVTDFADAESALQHIADQVPDLVLSDVKLPGASGLDLARDIRENPACSHVPVIMLTALAAREHRLDGLSAAVDDYLTKPFDDTELLARIANLLSTRDALKNHYRRHTLGLPEANEQRQDRFLTALTGQLKLNPYSEISDLVEAVHLSERQLQRKLQALTGMTPSDYLRQFRLRRAAALLEQGHTATEAGLEAGFKDYSHFSRTFKAEYGLPPGRYAALNVVTQKAGDTLH